MEKKLNIPNIFHFMYDSSRQDDLYEYEYFSIKSVFEINKPDKIYFHYNNEPKGKLWDKIKKILTLNRTNIELSVNKTKYIFIFKILLKFGGIYLELKSLCINAMKELLKYNFFKSVNNEIIGSEPKSFMAFKYLQYLLGNNNIINFTEKFGIRNINGQFINNFLIEDLNYDTSENNINNIFFKEISDYSFSQYFHLVKNCNFIFFNNTNNLNNLTLEYIFNKITIYNLLVRHILSYNLINSSIKINNFKYKFINNIDCIYWINLNSSNKRRENMKKLLRNINIQNQIITAVDGNIIQDIASKYYYSENNIYPKYSNKEYAVLLSHLKALETYSLYNEPKFKVALICEDDICYDFINYWNCDIKTIVEGAPEDWDIIMLGYFSLNINFSENYKKWDNEWSALSYLVNYNGMYKLKNIKKDDLWVCKDSDLMVSDNYIFSKFNTYVYKYPYFTFPNENDSTFHEDHLNYHRIYKISNYLTLEKIYDDYLKEI
jgi:hypothetical protein